MFVLGHLVDFAPHVAPRLLTDPGLVKGVRDLLDVKEDGAAALNTMPIVEEGCSKHDAFL